MKLSEKMIAEADEVGRRRRGYAVSVDRRAGNNLIAADDKALWIDIVGARGERAGKLFLDPIEWHSFKTGPVDELPDLGSFVDVKTVEADNRGLISRADRVKPDWAYLLISAQSHPYYWIVGWLWGRQLAIEKYKAFPDRPAFLAKSADLNKPHELLHIVREMP